MDYSKGTPVNLQGAIANALAEKGILIDPDQFESLVSCIHDHVKDRLAQDFAVAILKRDNERGLKELYAKLFPESKAALRLVQEAA